MRQGNTRALPRYTWRFYYLVEGIWKPWGLLCLFRTGLPNAEEISLCSTNFPKLRISASGGADYTKGALTEIA